MASKYRITILSISKRLKDEAFAVLGKKRIPHQQIEFKLIGESAIISVRYSRDDLQNSIGGIWVLWPSGLDCLVFAKDATWLVLDIDEIDRQMMGSSGGIIN